MKQEWCKGHMPESEASSLPSETFIVLTLMMIILMVFVSSMLIILACACLQPALDSTVRSNESYHIRHGNHRESVSSCTQSAESGRHNAAMVV